MLLLKLFPKFMPRKVLLIAWSFQLLMLCMLLSAFSFQTISFVYIVTAVVGVEAWYEPFLFNFLYRDLFTAMIIGKKLHVEACFNITLLSKPVFGCNKQQYSFPSSKQNNPTTYRVSTKPLRKIRSLCFAFVQHQAL